MYFESTFNTCTMNSSTFNKIQASKFPCIFEHTLGVSRNVQKVSLGGKLFLSQFRFKWLGPCVIQLQGLGQGSQASVGKRGRFGWGLFTQFLGRSRCQVSLLPFRTLPWRGFIVTEFSERPALLIKGKLREGFSPPCSYCLFRCSQCKVVSCHSGGVSPFISLCKT